MKQLWRFTLKREEAVQVREEEKRWSGSAAQPSPRLRSNSASSMYYSDSGVNDGPGTPKRQQQQENGGGSLLSFLYRVTVGRGATTPGGSQLPLRGPTFNFEGVEAGSFNILKYARGGKECLAAFSSMCLATLRLQDLVDVLLLLASHRVEDIPYPPPLREPVASLDFPWAQLEEEGGGAERIVDCYIALREQFSTTAATTSTSSRPEPLPIETKLKILARVCSIIKAYDCLAAIGTKTRDMDMIRMGLQGAGLGLQDYKAVFLDERHDIEPFVRSFVGSLGTSGGV